MRNRAEQVASKVERSAIGTADIAVFRAGRVVLKLGHEKAAARSPLEKSEAQSKSHAERRKSAPAV